MRKNSAWLITAILFATVSLFAMRFLTHAIPFGLPAGLLLATNTFLSVLIAEPFFIDFASQTVCLVGAIIFLGPLAFIALARHSSKSRAKDSGSEHGEERFATESEAAEFSDKKDFVNNFWFTEHCGLIFRAINKKQRDLQYAINFNLICYGTSGTGKSQNLAKVTMLQSVGDSLKPVRVGWTNIVGHLKRHTMMERISIWANAHIDKVLNGIKGRLRCFMPFTKTVTKIKKAISSKRLINNGFDFFGTDPKGDNIKDVGYLFEAAGYDIKCFNTIDPTESLHYNPLAYIETRLVDIKSPDDLINTLRIEFEDKTVQRLRLGDEVAATERTVAGVNGTIVMDTDIVRQIITYDELVEVDKEIKEDLREISSRLGKEVEDVVRGFSYKRSEVTITLIYRNTDWREHSPQLHLALDPALEPISMNSLAEQGAALNPTTSMVIWEVGTVEGRDKEVDDDLAPYRVLKVFLRIKPMRVADGVSLTKNINCLVKNLNEDVTVSGDMKFWEDTKLLAFMSYVALQFERYEPQYRNLPETLRILNMAMVDAENPNAASPLDILMEAWETGFIYMPNNNDENLGPRSRRRSGSWQPSGNDPHDPTQSMALHCYKAYNSGAAETRQSVLATCHGAFARLLGEDIQELLRYDEMALDTLGEAGQKQAIFVIPDAVDDTFGFLFALMTFQSMSMFCDRAVKKHGGRAPRHVRFEIDEAGTIGKITLLDRIIAVMRSFNGSIALYFQSKAQAVKIYGEKEAEIIIDNCTTTTFLGSQSKETLEMISMMIGDETVYGATNQRTFDACGFTASENEHIQSTSRKVRSGAQLRREQKHKMLVFVLGMRPVLDWKFPTNKHPLYRYIDPGSPRELIQPVCLFNKRFDYQEYRDRKEGQKAT